MIAPYIVASRWCAARAALRQRITADDASDHLVDSILEWAFCDQAPGVWCTQWSHVLDEIMLGWCNSARATQLYGVRSAPPYGTYVQKSLLMASTPLEVASYSWMACAQYNSERLMREHALDEEGLVTGFGVLAKDHRETETQHVFSPRWNLRQTRRTERFNNTARHPGVEEGSKSAVGCWFASEQRSWGHLWETGAGALVHDTYTTTEGVFGYRIETEPALSAWTIMESAL